MMTNYNCENENFENFQMEINKKSPKSLNKHDIFLISLLCFSNLLLGGVYSFIAPFFPSEVSIKYKFFYYH